MKRFIIISLMVLVSMSSYISFASAGENAKEPRKKIDLQMTLKFIRGWSSRDKWDKFPESPSFAYYNVYSTKALKGDITPELRGKIVDYLRNCQMKDGGFSAGPDYKDSNTIFTYYALATLDILNSLDAINRKQAVRYIQSLARSDGSIKAKASDTRATLATTYYGIASIALLNAFDAVDKNSVIAYIHTYREKGKGFCMVQGTISMPGSTFMAVRSLLLLGGMTPAVKTDVINYLKETRYSGRVKNEKYSTLPTIEDLSYVLETLADLSTMHVVDKESVYQFIQSLYIPDNGGFGPEPGLGTTPPSTFHAVLCLEKLGKLK